MASLNFSYPGVNVEEFLLKVREQVIAFLTEEVKRLHKIKVCISLELESNYLDDSDDDVIIQITPRVVTETNDCNKIFDNFGNEIIREMHKRFPEDQILKKES